MKTFAMSLSKREWVLALNRESWLVRLRGFGEIIGTEGFWVTKPVVPTVYIRHLFFQSCLDWEFNLL